MMADSIVLDVEAVGVRGDGIAHHAGERIFLPLTAPGDRVEVRLGERRGAGRSAEILALLTPGARAAPRCVHFGACGGCALQHLSDAAYEAAKLQWLGAALESHGIKDVALSPLRRLPAGTRRRARLAIRRPRQA
jgi:23S rRNA (uracil1939-C5)-methyltransferase